MLQNLRLGVRNLARTPGFTTSAILVLALGIGLATAVFTIADALLLRPLPVQDQDRIVVLWGETADGSFKTNPLLLPDARVFAEQTQSLERTAFFQYGGAAPAAVRDGDHISRLNRALVSGQFFAVLGVRPVLGRILDARDDVAGVRSVVVLSYSAWQQRFGGDPQVVGRRIQFYEDNVTSTIVGVMPQGLDYPRGTDFWAPLVATTRRAALSDAALDVDVIGRLAPFATIADARGELTAFFGRADAPAWQRDVRGVAYTLPRLVLGDTRPALMAFGAACVLLLLITCINVANLLLVRGLGRTREVAVRSALGGSRAQIARLLIAENALLALGGGGLGVMVARGAVGAFVAFAPSGFPHLDEIQLNASVIGGAAAITAAALLIFGLFPALATARPNLQRGLRSDARQTPTRRARRTTEALVVGQLALAVVVLAVSGVVVRSLIELERADLAFEPSHLMIGELAFREDQYASAAKRLALFDTLTSRLDAVPGVRGVSPVVTVPFSVGWDGRPVVEGQSAEDAFRNPVLNIDLVGPGYLKTFGIPLLRGRWFTAADAAGAPPVVAVSQSAARQYWPHEDPVGKRLTFQAGGPWLTVVGVIPDIRYRDLRDARPSIYIPLRQSFFPFAPTTLAIRTTTAPGDLVPAIRHAIADAAPGVELSSAVPFGIFLGDILARPRLDTLLLAVFAGAALLVAAIGLFGLLATMIRQRTHELGVRMALGATRRDLRRMIVGRGVLIAGIGAAIGLAGAALANRLVVALLYEVSPTDGMTLAAVTVLLLTVAGCASVAAARASTRIDPAIALRAE